MSPRSGFVFDIHDYVSGLFHRVTPQRFGCARASEPFGVKWRTENLRS